jgi:hypothetical protein
MNLVVRVDGRSVMGDPVIRRAEHWEGLDRMDILRGMSDRQLSLAATRLLQFVPAAANASQPDMTYPATCRQDVHEVVGEMLRRDKWLPGWESTTD